MRVSQDLKIISFMWHFIVSNFIVNRGHCTQFHVLYQNCIMHSYHMLIFSKTISVVHWVKFIKKINAFFGFLNGKWTSQTLQKIWITRSYAKKICNVCDFLVLWDITSKSDSADGNTYRDIFCRYQFGFNVL